MISAIYRVWVDLISSRESGISDGVSGRVRRLTAALILCLAIGCPIVEMFDHWDQTFTDGNDTEANVVIVALCVGLAFLTAARVRIDARPSRSRSSSHHVAACTSLVQRLVAPLTPDIRPPTPLRV